MTRHGRLPGLGAMPGSTSMIVPAARARSTGRPGYLADTHGQDKVS